MGCFQRLALGALAAALVWPSLGYADSKVPLFCVFNPPAPITIHDGGLFRGADLLADLHLAPLHDKGFWTAKLTIRQNTGATFVGGPDLDMKFFEDGRVTFDDAVGYCSRMPYHPDFGD